MTPFFRLLWREVRQGLPTTAASVVAILAWYTFLASRVGRWNEGLVLAMTQMPLWWLPLGALWRTYQSFKNDLDTARAYLLLSLPVYGWQLAGAKLLAVWLEAVLYVGATFGGIAAMVQGVGVPGLPPDMSAAVAAQFARTLVDAVGILLAILVAFAMPAWLVLVQAAWGAGRTVRRGRHVLMGLAFLAGGWLLVRAAVAGAAVLDLLPPVPTFPYPDVYRAPGGVWTVETRWLAMHPGPWLAVVLATAVGFFGTTREVERALDAEGARWPAVAGVAIVAAAAAVDLYLNGVGIFDALLQALAGGGT